MTITTTAAVTAATIPIRLRDMAADVSSGRRARETYDSVAIEILQADPAATKRDGSCHPDTMFPATLRKLPVPILVGLAVLAGAVGIRRVLDRSSSPDRRTDPTAPGARARATVSEWRPSGGPAEIPAQFVADTVERRLSGTVHGSDAALVHVRLDVPDPRVWRGLDVAIDSSGRFDTGVLPAARYQLLATADGKTSRVWTVDTRTESATDLDVYLHACRVVEGMLVATDDRMHRRGSPVAGADVELAGVLVGQTDEEGRFAVCVPAHGWRLAFRAPGFGVSQLGGPGPPDVIRDNVEPMLPTDTLRGRVVDATGAPVSGVLVHPFANVCLACEPWAPVMAITDAEGRFVIEQFAQADRFALNLVEDDVSHMVRIKPAGDIEVTLPPRGSRDGYRPAPVSPGVVRGVVVSDGVPVPDARVIAHIGDTDRVGTFTDRDGRFEMPLREMHGTAYITADDPVKHVDGSISVELRGTEVDVTVPLTKPHGW